MLHLSCQLKHGGLRLVNETEFTLLCQLILGYSYSRDDNSLRLKALLTLQFSRTVINCVYARVLLYECTTFTVLSRELIRDLRKGKIVLYEVAQSLMKAMRRREKFLEVLQLSFDRDRLDTAKEQEDAISILQFVQHVAEALTKSISSRFNEKDVLSKPLLKLIIECFDPLDIDMIDDDAVVPPPPVRSDIFLYFASPIFKVYDIPIPEFLIRPEVITVDDDDDDDNDEGIVQDEVPRDEVYCQEDYDPQQFSLELFREIKWGDKESVQTLFMSSLYLLRYPSEVFETSEYNPVFQEIMKNDEIISNAKAYLRVSRIIQIANYIYLNYLD